MTDQTPWAASPAPGVPGSPRPKVSVGIQAINWIALSLAILGVLGFFPTVATISLMGMGGEGARSNIRVSAILVVIVVVIVLALSILALVLTRRQRGSAGVPITAVVLSAVTVLATLVFLVPFVFSGL